MLLELYAWRHLHLRHAMPGIVNESDVVSDLAALADGVMSQNVATGYLKDVSPEDARRLDGVSAFSLRSMICPGEPEVN